MLDFQISKFSRMFLQLLANPIRRRILISYAATSEFDRAPEIDEGVDQPVHLPPGLLNM